ncbi:uncharacterized protein TOT_040000300 [Theileria orientalis strain Shintoku]|uniref:Sphingomyelin synthase-like domain-containing protein n=1 Tax=Theileria orientalis strain Shintoku TaxID=869250 RepID=J4DAE3_THEOR|nr:uncharacterized protein TOT_040000300 [Theileria orientalis strain Shintoku]PVC51354.1 hypothetical protein MACL_00001616 [Theileria orientalis]BAM41920.1 uncharacterized protein TOT_040000300 [Theileria orientalis strain Shintoku]|eukprot:XP_009692221.1 uncharacterized protein TOT_040000300 [Theileria orientalis strain Shintoku]
MLKAEVYSAKLTGSGKSSDSTKGFDDMNLLYKYDGEVSLEREVVEALNEGRKLIYGCLFRMLILIPTFLLFYTFYRGMVFLIDVYFHDHTLERFLDRLHENIDDRHLPFINRMSDGLFYAFVVVLMLRFILFYPVLFNVQVLLRFAYIYVFTYLLRGLAVIFTTIPSPYPYCVPLRISDKWWKTYATMMFGEEGKLDCTGLLFSGRAFIMFLGLIILGQNSGPLFTMLMTLYALVTAVMIVATKFHYTVDVMFSLLFAGSFYYFYYSRIDSFGVYFLNKINSAKHKEEEDLKMSKLESSAVTRGFAELEQLPKLISVGHKLKSLQPLVYGSSNISDGVFKEYKSMVYFFGIKECDDLLSLYRGTKSFNFSYWKRLRLKLRRRKLQSSILD